MGWCGSIKIVRTPASNFFSSSGGPKTWKMIFFRVSHIYGTFWSRRPYMGRTMWKLTSWRIGKCDGFPCSDVLNPSYGWSKSTESEILSLSSKIVGVKKKDTATIFKISAPYWISVKVTHFFPRWFNMEPQSGKLWPCLFFLTPPICQEKSWDLTRLWAAITPV